MYGVSYFNLASVPQTLSHIEVSIGIRSAALESFIPRPDRERVENVCELCLDCGYSKSLSVPLFLHG